MLEDCCQALLPLPRRPPAGEEGEVSEAQDVSTGPHVTGRPHLPELHLDDGAQVSLDIQPELGLQRATGWLHPVERKGTPQLRRPLGGRGSVFKAQGQGPVETHHHPRPSSYDIQGPSSWTDTRHTLGLSHVVPGSEAWCEVLPSLKPPPHGQRVKHSPCLSWGQPLPQNLQTDLWPLAPTRLRHPFCTPRSDLGITSQNHKLASFGPLLSFAVGHASWLLGGLSIPGPWTSTGPQLC